MNQERTGPTERSEPTERTEPMESTGPMPVLLKLPAASSRFPLGNLVRFRRDPILFLRRLAAEYGDVISFAIASAELVLVNDPALIYRVTVTDHRKYYKSRGLERAKRLLGEGLLTSEGETHLQHRRMLQPAFHRQRIAGYAASMVESADAAALRWNHGDTIDITAEMQRLTLAIVGRTLFDEDIESEAPEIGQALGEALGLFHFLTLPFAEKLDRLPLPPVRRFHRAKARLDQTVYRLIAQRRAEGVDHGDFLSMVISAQDEEDPAARLTDEEVRDQVMTIFLAGHETTATALIWTLYLLALNPGVEKRLEEELRDVLDGRKPELEDVDSLPWTRAVLTESMRLYPPAWMIGRRAVVDTDLGGFAVPRDTIILMAPSVTQVDDRFFPEPARFAPSRWLFEDAAELSDDTLAGTARDLPKMAYYPFGGGPRTCIGERFAWMEMTLVLAVLMQRCRFSLVPGQQIKARPIITQRPSGAIRMRVEVR